MAGENYNIKTGGVGLLKREFNLTNLKTLSYTAAGPAPIGVNDPNKYEGKIEQPTNEPATVLYNSKLGTPVVSNLVIEAGQYTDDFGTVKSFQKLVFDTVLISISQSKNIVKTAIQGRPGTVKQFIANGDFEVQINLIICGENGTFPQKEVAQIKEMLNAPIAVNVSGWWLQIWDVDSIVIESFEVPQTPGGISYQPISIKASSDAPIELEILNG